MQLKRSVSPPRQGMMGSKHLLQQTKQKKLNKTANKNKDTPRIAHSI